MNESWKRRAGFTIVEVMTAATILLSVVAMSLKGFVYTLKASHQSDTQDDLDVDVQTAMEQLKRDIRLSSLTEMYYYPAGAQRYTAISFPKVRANSGSFWGPNTTRTTRKTTIMWGMLSMLEFRCP